MLHPTCDRKGVRFGTNTETQVKMLWSVHGHALKATSVSAPDHINLMSSSPWKNPLPSPTGTLMSIPSLLWMTPTLASVPDLLSLWHIEWTPSHSPTCNSICSQFLIPNILIQGPSDYTLTSYLTNRTWKRYYFDQRLQFYIRNSALSALQ